MLNGVILIFVIIFALKMLDKITSKNSKSSACNFSDSKTYCYKSKGTILTPAEQLFFRHLKEAVPYLGISLQVRLADVIKPDALDQKEHYGAFAKIRSKHLDFVLYDPITFQIIAAIELDDSSHSRKDRIERDLFLNKAMEQASIPLHRFKAKAKYNADEIANQIAIHTD